MATGYIVDVPLVVIRDASGQDRYLYKNAVVPSDVDDEHRKQLVKEGMLVKGNVPSAAQGDSGGADGSQVDPSDPGKSGVKAVQAFLDTASDEDRERVLAAELEGQARKGIVEYEPKGSGE